MAEEGESTEQWGDTAVAEVKPVLKKPPMYQVVMINDDFTPMEFVVEILTLFFNMNEAKATRVMLLVHRVGKAVCGIYIRDVAETKALQVNDYARSHNYPLLCITEVAE